MTLYWYFLPALNRNINKMVFVFGFQERQRRPPRTSGLLFTWDDGSLKCVDDIDSILSREFNLK